MAGPEHPWEELQMGGGTPPLLTRHGWLVLSYGVSGHLVEGAHWQERLRHAIGALVLARDDPRQIRYRSTRPLLEPEHPAEQAGMMPRVIVPTGIDPRPEPEDPEGCDVYYGMANTRIGVARLHMPEVLPGMG